VEQESQLISGPQESSISGSSSIPWKGRLRSSNIIHGSSQTSSRNSHVDDELNDSEKSVGEESRIHVKNVFFHGDLHEEVYMEQPPGYVD
jgi:hypothetical protein